MKSPNRSHSHIFVILCLKKPARCNQAQGRPNSNLCCKRDHLFSSFMRIQAGMISSQTHWFGFFSLILLCCWLWTLDCILWHLGLSQIKRLQLRVVKQNIDSDVLLVCTTNLAVFEEDHTF